MKELKKLLDKIFEGKLAILYMDDFSINITTEKVGGNDSFEKMFDENLEGQPYGYENVDGNEYVLRAMLTEEEIIENNKLIIGFMDDIGQHKIDYKNPTDRPYHSSWDWLMPVVEKVSIVSSVFQIHGERSNYSTAFVGDKPYSHGATLMQSIYTAVIVYLKQEKK